VSAITKESVIGYAELAFANIRFVPQLKSAKTLLRVYSSAVQSCEDGISVENTFPISIESRRDETSVENHIGLLLNPEGPEGIFGRRCEYPSRTAHRLLM
jgi:hypothetical protein